MTPHESIKPNQSGFESDPLGYGALAWHKWAMAQTMAGIDVDMEKGPTSEDLKSPVLWLSHAHAMSEAARVLLAGYPDLEPMPSDIRGVCHCQYHAVALMLVGYSLEICLKAMVIIRHGIAEYQVKERKYFHHSLDTLADFVPDLSEKDMAILKGLSHYVSWAGRYPDPGFGREARAEAIFTLSESYQISARDLFTVAARVMRYASTVASEA